MASRSSHRPVETVETAFDIVDTLKRTEGGGVSELADELGLAKSTVHRHLKTLESRGLVVQEGNSYHLSTWFLDYGVHVRNRHPLYDLAKPKVDELADVTDEKVWCVVEEHGMGVHVYGAQGRHSVKTHARIGKRTPLHQYAAGKAILASLPDERVESIRERYGLSAKTAQTITDREELFEQLETIRERGYAFNREESVTGVHAVGAPIEDETGTAIGALSVAGPANRLRGDVMTDELPELLLGATNEIEINLAHS
ncbi:IclR family transcriptional regulator [Natronobacterium gregoryi]|uniref:Transcriptional regulator n=2 Tax=Natronobacterium gregoryi TaxID=44930 RepID=L0AF70_NATGS|nr:IclR family transcriptional regulator [Natronobacterium gregoryi]AFZ72486.1 transcriptional regulator [Natronobacterium gregoryi SP2]ELY74358.1 IclR family transcriptional regulator [Natronobacterium gregoryi SP2]PLK21457.1 IclR family transcriptional regulator [Natronobacterium gregoryi SP2]SFI77374.1 transcriptional regulator, IclR family [Natronobacterium gregoryi]